MRNDATSLELKPAGGVVKLGSAVQLNLFALNKGGAPEGDNICARDLTCMIGTVVDAGTFNYYRGTCVRPGSCGDACGDMAPCKGYLRCQGGVCADFDPDSCGAPADAGTDG